ncbi:MAG: hypothetical protein AABM66_11800 [Actinomycetota bacterium]
MLTLLDNRWIARAGNLSFLAGLVVLVVRLLRGLPLTALIAVLLAVGTVLMALPYLAHVRRSPPPSQGKEGHIQAKRLARRVNSELDASRKRVDDAVERGSFWNVRVEGLQHAEWDAARDFIADEAPAVWDAVDPAYVLIHAMNDAANDHFHRGVRRFDARVPEELKRLRIKIRSAQAALQEFFGKAP